MKISINITDNQFSAATKEEMWNVYKKYYTYSKDDFMNRIAKNSHFAIYTHAGKIVGFTGLRITRTKIEGKSSLFMYFGQTVIETACRGHALLPFTGLKLCLKYFKDLFFSDIYFWCDALTYKSYLVFAKSLSLCYPSRKQQMSESIKNLINYIGQKHYADSYCSTLGTVRKSKKLVSDPSVSISNKDEQDADIRFFMKVNPNHAKGHGLITLAKLNRNTFSPVLYRFANSIIKNLRNQMAALVQNLFPRLAKLKRTISTSS
jgi:hypothetical protein